MDPTYGYDRNDLAAVGAPPPPDDFADFWRALYERARDVMVEPRIIEPGSDDGPHSSSGSSLPTVTRQVTFATTDGLRLGGWLTVPVNRPVVRGLVYGHGYGGRSAPEEEQLLPDAAVLYFCSRGLPTLSLQPGIGSTSQIHVLHGIEHRDTYVHGGCAADVWCAATALTQLVPEAAGRLDYVGGSFGGGIGALALPWDDRFTAGCLTVPSFGNHPLRMTLPCTGSGQAVTHYADHHPEVADVLRYFDAATAATFLRQPTLVAPALADPGVPPPGQFAVANSLAGPVELVTLTAGHMPYPEAEAEQQALRKTQQAFLTG